MTPRALMWSLLLLCPAAVLPGQDSNPSFATGRSAIGIAIELNLTHAFVQVRVQGSEPRWFLLDTGATSNVLDRRCADAIGVKGEFDALALGAGASSRRVQLARDVRFALPGTELAEQTVALMSLEDLEPRSGRAIDGILGYGFFRGYVVTIDYRARQLHLHDRRDWKYEGDGTVVPLRLQHGHPTVEAAVAVGEGEPITGRFTVDTGATLAVLLTRRFTRRHGLLDAFPRVVEGAGGYGIGGETKAVAARLAYLELGGLRFGAPPVSLSQDRRGATAGLIRAGLIGSRILELCRTTFDYERERMILEPYGAIDRVPDGGLSGMTVVTGGRGAFHEFRVERVLPGSPAAEAGIEPGDRILRVGGKPAGELSLHRITELLSADGKRVPVLVDREGKERAFELALRRSM